MAAASETVFFAIQSGLRLYTAGRKAYVDATRGRPLDLPLPRTPGLKAGSAKLWFKEEEAGKAIVQENERIRFLVTSKPLTTEQEQELLALYLACRTELEPILDDGSPRRPASSDMLAMLTVRQWAEDEAGAPRSALQQVAGTLIELAVDYYASTPGAISEKTPEGRALLSFLEAIDDVDFANTPVRDVAGDMMMGLIDAVAANPDVVSGGQNEQAFVRSITRSLATSANALLANDEATSTKQAAGTWLNLIARSIVEGGAETVLANPALFFDGKDEGESELVKAVTGTLASLVLGEDKLTFRRLLSGDGMKKIAQSALGAVVNNPQLLKVDNKGIENILVALAGDLALREDLAGPDLFPDLARIVLEKTGENLELVWGKRMTDPKKNLLLVAVKSAMKELARKPPTGSTWKPTFTKDHFLSVAEVVLDEVVEQPDWLVKRAGESSDNLGVAVGAMLDSLRAMDERRISADTGITIMRAGLQAVALRASFLDKVETGDGTEKVALSAVIDAVFSSIFSDDANADARWLIARNSSIQVVVEIALERVAEFGVDEAHLARVRNVADRLADGTLRLTDFDDVLTQELAAVA